MKVGRGSARELPIGRPVLHEMKPFRGLTAGWPILLIPAQKEDEMSKPEQRGGNNTEAESLAPDKFLRYCYCGNCGHRQTFHRGRPGTTLPLPERGTPCTYPEKYGSPAPDCMCEGWL